MENEPRVVVRDITRAVHEYYHHPADPPECYRRRSRLPSGQRVEIRRYQDRVGQVVWEGLAEDDVSGTFYHPEQQEAWICRISVHFTGNHRAFQDLSAQRNPEGQREWERDAPFRRYARDIQRIQALRA